MHGVFPFICLHSPARVWTCFLSVVWADTGLSSEAEQPSPGWFPAALQVGSRPCSKASRTEVTEAEAQLKQAFLPPAQRRGHTSRVATGPLWRDGMQAVVDRMGKQATESDVLSPWLLSTLWSAVLPSPWLGALPHQVKSWVYARQHGWA